MKKKTIKDIKELEGKKIIVRFDFNVPIDKETGEITDNNRIVEALPTLKYLLENNAKIIIASHLGRPKGEFKPEFSLKPVAKELEKLLGKEIKLADDVVGESAKELTSNMEKGEIVLLENVRFHSEEEKNDPEFAKKLASLGEIYVNDAFGAAHRAHASTEGIAKNLPSVAGFLMEKELEFLGTALEKPERPFVAILGGSKVSDKIEVIENLLNKVDTLIIGGAMANTFLKAQGNNVGESLCELDKVDLAKELIEKAKVKGVKLILPIDVTVGKEFEKNTESKIVDCDKIEDNWKAFDIGPNTIKLCEEELEKVKTVIWNGPVGLFEFEQFAVGTNAITQILSKLKNTRTIIGGGDTAAAVKKTGLEDKMTHISTGGGASLELLEGKLLPGVECLSNKCCRKKCLAENELER